MQRTKRTKLLLVAGLTAFLAACAKEEPVQTQPTETPKETKPVVTEPVETGPAVDSFRYVQEVIGDRVLFDYDSSELDAQDRRVLQAQAEWLNGYGKGYSITIEGHCDERGTRDYNLALGDRRANAVKNYLVALGVSASRIKTISYGKERPIALCSNESCWSQNRRGVMVPN